jgi:glutamine amidotransferase-like uncharacterized protein
MSSAVRRSGFLPIREVLVYSGHERHPLFGPYPDNIEKRINMFNQLNPYRVMQGCTPWEVKTVSGEEIEETLDRKVDPETTLFVVTSGQSTRLDKVFTQMQLKVVNDFFHKGGRGYFTCGSSYWTSWKRVFTDICEDNPEIPKEIIKTSRLPLLQMVAEGPLCLHLGSKYKAGFYSNAIRITDGQNECTVYLSGGGGFHLPNNWKTPDQKISVLVRYVHSELERIGKKKEELPKWQNAVVMASIGERGAGIFSMFHPYYDPKDFDPERYEAAFPDSGTNWREVKERLSPLGTRMRFVFNSMLHKLETGDFSSSAFGLLRDN